MIRRFVLLALLIAVCCGLSAYAQGPQFTAAPNVIRPGKLYTFTLASPSQGTVDVVLLDHTGQKICDLYADYPVEEGENKVIWDGLFLDSTIVPTGEYTIQLLHEDGESSETSFRIGMPYPLLTHLRQTSGGPDEGGFEISYNASVLGKVNIQLQDHQLNTTMQYLSLEAEQGENSFFWEYDDGEDALPVGSYSLIMTLYSENGEESSSQKLYFEMNEQESDEEFLINDTADEVIGDSSINDTIDELPTFNTEDSSSRENIDIAIANLPATDDETPPESVAAAKTPPYSTVDNGSYWSMTPGELDDSVIWEVLMQPITVYDGGLDTKPKTHAYVMENPDGTGERVAQLHAQSQGLNVIGEKNEYGYVLVEVFSNYDENYNPKTDQERADAFKLKRGYVKASHLKTVKVMPDIAFVIDKLTQRMYVFENGVRTEELLIATGKISDKKYYNETIPGEYITISHTGDFPSGNMVCRMAIRINGGILLHEVPHKVNADGTRNYSAFEGYLGTKQSHGCIRIQRLPSEKMKYNAKWIWDTLEKGKPYKVIIWDDMNPRYDQPTTWYPNPKN